VIIVAVLVVFAAIVCAVLAMSWQADSPMVARMAAIRGERTVGSGYGSRQLTEPIGTRVFGPLAGSLGRKLATLLPTRWIQYLEKRLVQAGQPTTLTGFLVAVFLAEAGTLFIGFMLALSMGGLAGKGLIVLGASGVLGVFLPRTWLESRVRLRQKVILKSLPDAFDLVTVCAEAGLGLDAALARVAEKVKGPFGEELSVSLREISLGKLRRDALQELGERTGVPDLVQFVNAVIQAEAMGTSIATVLRIQAEQMRVKRRQRAEQLAQQAPVKMIFPLVLCIFPTLFIVILGPAGIRIYQTLVETR